MKEIGVISTLRYNLAIEINRFRELLKQLFPFIEICDKYIWNASLCILPLIFLLLVHMCQKRLDISIEV